MKWKPYTYLLKCPNGKYYYGVKYGKKKPNIANPDKFWITYFTSSKNVHDLISIYGKDAFSFEIRRTFETAEQAIKWESKVNKKLTTKSDKFLNDSFVDGRNQQGTNNGNYGKSMSEESKRKMVETRRKNNNGSYGGLIRDTSYNKTDEYKKLLSDNAKRQHKSGRIYSIVDESHICNEFEKFIFPINPDEYKTKGSRSSKITYFINNYYVEKFKDLLVKSKNPKAMCRRILMKHYENEYVYT